jgi:YegS/Rv2252/BmrU family lipid kinase
MAPVPARRRVRRLSSVRARTVDALHWRVIAHGAWKALRMAAVRLRTPARAVSYWVSARFTRRDKTVDMARSTPHQARARVIVNPTSGNVHGDFGLNDLHATVDWLTKNGMPTELCLTERPGHARELAREAAERGMEVVIAAGGDGTINDVIQALAGTDTALGVLPMGTVNVWAREMEIPVNTLLAREILLRGMRRRVDLGLAGERYFLLMAGIGFDAEVTIHAEQSRLKRVGLKVVDYGATTLRLGVTRRSTRVTLSANGRSKDANILMILIGNTRLYAGAFSFAKRAMVDDGLLDLVMMGDGSIPFRMSVFTRALWRRASLGPYVRYSRFREIELHSQTPLDVQVDGEPIGKLPMKFSVAPRALTVIVPSDAPAHLFTTPPLGA